MLWLPSQSGLRALCLQPAALLRHQLLRLAAALHRSRAALRLPRFTLRAAGNTLTIDFPPAWLDRHPLTGADLAHEAQFLAAAGFNLTLDEG